MFRLKNFIILGRSDKNLNKLAEKIMGDCLEAIIGAIYLDGGLKMVEKFILKFWNDYIEQSNLTFIDSKTQLQEYSLKKFKQLPTYTFHKKIGPEHKPLFKTEVKIPNSFADFRCSFLMGFTISTHPDANSGLFSSKLSLG